MTGNYTARRTSTVGIEEVIFWVPSPPTLPLCGGVMDGICGIFCGTAYFWELGQWHGIQRSEFWGGVYTRDLKDGDV